ncbi:MAG: protein-tyrosine kinase [Lachnospiraceae bacterium]|nr:protein-tyrosine kinase [Lachnospiraceae bacterium]
MNPSNPNTANAVEIDLLDLLNELLRKWLIILLCAAVGALIGVLYSTAFVTPEYESSTRLYVVAKSGTNSGISTSELQASSLLSNDYAELVKSREVMETVIAEMNLTQGSGTRLMTASELSSRLSVSVLTNTRVVKITIKDTDPYKACDIANAIRSVAAKQIKRVTDSEAVNVVDEANIPTAPSNRNINRSLLIGGLLGFLVACIVIIVLYLLNDAVTTEDDVHKYLGLSTLGQIPLTEGQESQKKKRSIFRKILKGGRR